MGASLPLTDLSRKSHFSVLLLCVVPHGRWYIHCRTAIKSIRGFRSALDSPPYQTGLATDDADNTDWFDVNDDSTIGLGNACDGCCAAASAAASHQAPY